MSIPKLENMVYSTKLKKMGVRDRLENEVKEK